MTIQLRKCTQCTCMRFNYESIENNDKIPFEQYHTRLLAHSFVVSLRVQVWIGGSNYDSSAVDTKLGRRIDWYLGSAEHNGLWKSFSTSTLAAVARRYSLGHPVGRLRSRMIGHLEWQTYRFGHRAKLELR